MHDLYREPLFADSAVFPVALDADDVEARIPHRHPMRLLDAVVAVDLEGLRAAGVRRLDPADPIFQGHFPGDPIFPGVLQLEAIGQLGLCLAAELARRGADDAPEVSAPRVVRVVDARFLAAARPPDMLRVVAAVVDRDPFLNRVAGQVWVGERLCCGAVMEVYLG